MLNPSDHASCAETSLETPDPTLAKSVNYAWPYKVPVFKAFEYYSRRPYRSLPSLEAVRGFCKDELKDMNLVFESTPGLERFRGTLKSVLATLAQDTKAQPEGCANVVSHANAIILAIHRLIIGDIKSVIEEARERAEMTVLQSRAHPGRSAYLYILFLQDHIKLGLVYAERATQDLQQVGGIKEETSICNLYLGVQNDLSWLLINLRETISHLDSVLGQAKTLQELKGSQTTQVMNVLVAIYVPLAFVSSYFGTNTVDFNGGNVTTSTFWTVSIPLMILTILTPLSATVSWNAVSSEALANTISDYCAYKFNCQFNGAPILAKAMALLTRLGTCVLLSGCAYCARCCLVPMMRTHSRASWALTRC